MTSTTKKIAKWSVVILSLVVLPLGISLVANFTTWFSTKEKVEVTLKLDGWITIGSVKFGDLPDLMLTLQSEPVENILKITWRIVNTGNKGIQGFESGPFITFPKDLNVVSAKISETSQFLKIKRELEVKDEKAEIKSLGVFNPGNYFRVDFYLKDVTKDATTNEYFSKWELLGKSLDISITKDLSIMAEKLEKPSLFKTFRTIPAWFWYVYFGFLFSFMIFRRIQDRYFPVRKYKWEHYPIEELLSVKKSLTDLIAKIDNVVNNDSSGVRKEDKPSDTSPK